MFNRHRTETLTVGRKWVKNQQWSPVLKSNVLFRHPSTLTSSLSPLFSFPPITKRVGLWHCLAGSGADRVGLVDTYDQEKSTSCWKTDCSRPQWVSTLNQNISFCSNKALMMLSYNMFTLANTAKRKLVLNHNKRVKVWDSTSYKFAVL